MDNKFKPETLCVQAGWQPKKGEPRVLPIYQSTTFKYETSEQMAKLFDLEESGYFYTRLQNPTNEAVAAKIAALEGGVAAMLTSSGQAASFFAFFNICEAGDHIVSATSIYGGTYNLLAVTLKKLGIECTFVDQDADQLPSVRMGSGHRHALHDQIYGRPCHERRRLYRGQRQFRLGSACREVPGTLPTGPFLPRIDLYQGIREISVHHESD